MTHEEPEFLTDIRDFITLFCLILRQKSSEWLELSIESGIGVWFAIESLVLAIHDTMIFKNQLNL